MDNKKLLMAGAAMVALTGVVAHEAEAATQAIPMNAVIVAPISLSAAQSLNFGSFSHSAAGTVVIDNAGTRTQTGGVNLITGVVAEQQAILAVTAATGVAMDLTLPAADTVTNGTTSMAVNAFSLDGVAGTTHTITNGLATVSYNIGATLNVAGTEVAGTYTGSFDVTVSYQ